MCRCTRWFSSLQRRQPPLEWLMDLNRKPLRTLAVVVAAIFLMQAFFFALFRGSLTAVFMGVAGAVCALIAFLLMLCSHRRQQHVRIEFGVIIALFVVGMVASGAMLIVEDDFLFRVRGHSNNMIGWKAIPAIFGFPLVPAALFVLASVAVDIATGELCTALHGDPVGSRMHTNAIAYGVAWLSLAWMNSARLRSIFDGQLALAMERALMESMLSMLCDGMIWLSQDGSTILRADDRINLIVGRNMAGTSLVEAIPEEERLRLQEHLADSKVAPCLLPSAIKTTSGDVRVDIFMVGNRNKAAKSGLPDFLIGVRLSGWNSLPHLPSCLNVEMDKNKDVDPELEGVEIDDGDAPDEVGSRRQESVTQASCATSVPETTATDRIFEAVNVDHWLEDTPEDQLAHMRRSLQSVVRLGQKEKWLLCPQEVHMARQVLGAGAFGVVRKGWLHGSPIAIKPSFGARSKDSAGNLVSLANEIRILRHVRHPNVVLFHGACIEPQQHAVWMVLECVQGPDLHEYVSQHSEDSEVHVRLQMMLDVACALRYLHAQQPQVVHGDLKCSNVLVEPGMPRAKLVDFGLSRLLKRHNVKPLGGTITWMAPEIICSPSGRPTSSADAFSFGRIAYYIITCRTPLDKVPKEVIINMARHGIAPALQWEQDKPLQRECSALCARLLVFQPAERPAMAQVHEEVLIWASSLQESEPDRAISKMTAEEPAPVAETASGAKHPGASLAQRKAKKLTLEDVKRLMLMHTAMSWNFPYEPGCCCHFHAATSELRRLCGDLEQANCNRKYKFYEEVHCTRCGVMDEDVDGLCPVCWSGMEKVASKRSAQCCSL